MNDKLLAIIRFYFAQCVFMNSIHYKPYSRLTEVQNRYRNITIGISGTTLIVIILQTIGFKENLTQLLSILSFCGMILTATSLIFTMYSKEDIGEIKSQHRNIAEEYKILRDSYMMLIEEAMSNAYDEKTLREKGQEFQKLYSAIGKYAPATTYNDYQNAQKGLGLSGKKDEEFTWSDKEIDCFLPPLLRIEEK
jgi:hypothetical protein